MVSQLAKQTEPEILYPVSDGEPLAETFDHLYVLLTTLAVLRQYLAGQRATVLANQYMYYVEGKPTARVAPDVMVIFNVKPGGRDNYKIWQEGEVPSVIFEITSEGTEDRDRIFKKNLYEQLGVIEYWLYDPKGEWIVEHLRGYRLRNDVYEPITDGRSEPLQLRVQVEGKIIGFTREDTGEKLLIPDELAAALERETEQRQQATAALERETEQRRQAEARAESAEAKAMQIEQEQQTAVTRLLKMGLSVEQVSEALGLGFDEVNAIATAQ
ncbi:MAG: Uma2 family endonuclease [Cyanobacteria bacterium P01_A01_bin.114]